MDSYYEDGNVAYAEIQKGHLVVENQGSINLIYKNTDTTTDVQVETTGEGKVAHAHAKSSTVVDNKHGDTVLNVTFDYDGADIVSDTTVDHTSGEYKTEGADGWTITKGETYVIDAAIEVERKESFAECNYWIGVASDSFASGNGTEQSPYIIKTAEQLSRIAYLLTTKDASKYKNAWYELASDIDLSAKCWIPISTEARKGKLTKMFSGHFDGKGHTISGLNDIGLSMSYIKTNTNATTPANTDGEYPYGLFGSVNGATITNLIIDKANIKVGTGDYEADGVTRYVGDSVGALIGLAEGSNIVSKITVKNSLVQGYDCVGGVIGRSGSKGTNLSITLSEVYNENTTVNAVRQAGGIIGQIGSGSTYSMSKVSNSGTITTYFIDDYYKIDIDKHYYAVCGIAIIKNDTNQGEPFEEVFNTGNLIHSRITIPEACYGDTIKQIA